MSIQTGDSMKTFQKLSLASLFAAGLVSSALAAPVTYTVDSNHTFPRFSYSHFGYSTQLSSFENTTGTVVYDAEAKTGSVEIKIDLKEVNTGSDLFNGHLQGADFFDTANHPNATFKSTAVVFEGDNPVRIDGNLTIKGITKPVSLTVTSFKSMPHPMAKKPALGANAYTNVKRSDFNAGKYAPYVGDEVRIDIAIEAIAK
ncbi:MAG: YceI family protein [Burkholderiaceae bacterium]